jgi:hypothetical protein
LVKWTPGIAGIAVGGGEVNRDGEVHGGPALDVVDEGEALLHVVALDEDDAGILVAGVDI